jgi:hypothetical protein
VSVQRIMSWTGRVSSQIGDRHSRESGNQFKEEIRMTMVRRFFICLVFSASVIPVFSLATSSPAGAATWQSWNRSCFKWILDIPKVDSQIQTDMSRSNYNYLTIDFAELAADSNHIRSCPPSPDRRSNALVRQYGSILYSAGYHCAMWTSTRSHSQFNVCVGWLTRKKAVENQLSNRLRAVLG